MNASDFAQPVHATTREAELFHLANHYRGVAERLLEKTQRYRVLYSDGVARELALELMTAPRPELLYFQPCSVLTAPSDGSLVVFLMPGSDEPTLGRWAPRSREWVTEMHKLPIKPRAYVPIARGAE